MLKYLPALAALALCVVAPASASASSKKKKHKHDEYVVERKTTVVINQPRPVYVQPAPVVVRTDPYYRGYDRYYYNQPSRRVVRDVQRELSRLRYYRGPIDGDLGKYTRRSIRQYQIDRRLPVSGNIDRPLLRSLRLI